VLLAAPAWAEYVIYVPGGNNVNPHTANVPIGTIFNGSFNAGNTVQYVSYLATFGQERRNQPGNRTVVPGIS
jgi:hypothetical protein